MITPKIPVLSIPWDPDEEKAGVRVVCAEERSFPQRDSWLSPHRKDYYLLQYISWGVGRHWVDMIPFDFKPQTVYFSSPEQVHVKEEVNIKGTVIAFTKEFLGLEQNRGLDQLAIIRNPQLAHELRVGHEQSLELEKMLQSTASAYRQQHPLRMDMLCAWIRLLLVFLSRIYLEQYGDLAPDNRRKLFYKFRDCLEENYAHAHETGFYSKSLNISGSHLNALLKEQTGKTATSHIHERLVLEAKRLLLYGDLTVKQIAYELGFSDASYFNRFFKKLTQYTPLEYRDQNVR